MKSIWKKTAAFCAAALLSAVNVQSASAGGDYPALWQGAYAGVHLGGGFGELDIKHGPNSGARDLDGIAGGLHLGYNLERGNVVFGIESDISWTDAEIKTNGVKFSQDFLASIRGRIGITRGSTLIYATGGVAWIDMEFQDGNDKESRTEAGYVVGAGLESKLNEKLSLKGEVLHYGFEEKVGNLKTELDTTVIRTGLTYSFN